MKRNKNLKKEPMKTIDPALLDEILGSVQPTGNAGSGSVIRQDSFSSFFHS